MGNDQRQDPRLRTLIKRLQSTPRDTSLHMFILKDGTLQRCKMGPAGPDLLLIIPTRMRPTVLCELHDVAKAGDLGASRAYDWVPKRFCWPDLEH